MNTILSDKAMLTVVRSLVYANESASLCLANLRALFESQEALRAEADRTRNLPLK